MPIQAFDERSRVLPRLPRRMLALLAVAGVASVTALYLNTRLASARTEAAQAASRASDLDRMRAAAEQRIHALTRAKDAAEATAAELSLRLQQAGAWAEQAARELNATRREAGEEQGRCAAALEEERARAEEVEGALAQAQLDARGRLAACTAALAEAAARADNCSCPAAAPAEAEEVETCSSSSDSDESSSSGEQQQQQKEDEEQPKPAGQGNETGQQNTEEGTEETENPDEGAQEQPKPAAQPNATKPAEQQNPPEDGTETEDAEHPDAGAPQEQRNVTKPAEQQNPEDGAVDTENPDEGAPEQPKPAAQPNATKPAAAEQQNPQEGEEETEKPDEGAHRQPKPAAQPNATKPAEQNPPEDGAEDAEHPGAGVPQEQPKPAAQSNVTKPEGQQTPPEDEGTEHPDAVAPKQSSATKPEGQEEGAAEQQNPVEPANPDYHEEDGAGAVQAASSPSRAGQQKEAPNDTLAKPEPAEKPAEKKPSKQQQLAVALAVLGAAVAAGGVPVRQSGFAGLVSGPENYLVTSALEPPLASLSVFWWHRCLLPSTHRVSIAASPDPGVVPLFMAALGGGSIYVNTAANDYFYAPGKYNFTDGAWWHVGISVEAGGNVTYYINGSPAGTRAFDAGLPLNASLYLTLGAPRWGRKLDGLLDDVALYRPAVGPAVARELHAARGQRGPVSGGLVALWDFDDPDAPLAAAFRDPAGAHSVQLRAGGGWSGPAAAPSERPAAPWRASPAVPAVVARGQAGPLSLLPAWAPAASSVFTEERIEAVVDGRNVTFVLLGNTPPVAAGLSGSIVALSKVSFYLAGTSDMSATDLTKTYMVDAEGQLFSVYLTSLPSTGSLYQVSATPDDTTYVSGLLPDADAVPIAAPGLVTNAFTVVCYAPGEWQGVNSTSFRFVVSDGLVNSSEYTVTFVITEPVETNKKALVSQNLSFTEASAAVNVTLKADKDVSNPRFILTSLPQYGTLRQPSSTESIKLSSKFSFVRQWASRAVNVSSFWYDAAGYYAPTHLLGRPDCYPTAGDCSGAWSPSSANSPEWIQLAFDRPTYIVGVEVYETYYPGNTVRVRCKAEDGGWFDLWRGSPDSAIRNRTDATRVLSPTLFLSNIPELSSEIRIDFAAAGVADSYVEIDAVMLIGATTIETASVAGTKLVYEPLPHVDALLQDPLSAFQDSFSFVINDADYYMRYRDLDISAATVTMHIAPANDAPFFSGAEGAEAFVVNSTRRTLLALPAVDYDGPAPVALLLRQEPKRGALFRADGTVLTAGSTAPSAEVYYRADDCGVYADAFVVAATDSLLTSPDQTITVSVQCSGKSELLTTVLVAVIVPVGAILAASVAAVVAVSAYMRRRVSVLEDEKEQLQDELSRFHKASDMINTPAEAAIMTLQDIKNRALHGGSFYLDDETTNFLEETLGFYQRRTGSTSSMALSIITFDGAVEEQASYTSWAFDPMALDSQQLLVSLVTPMLGFYDIFQKTGIDQKSYTKFISTIAEQYKSNSYHNAYHAADVLQAVYFMLRASKLGCFTETEVLALLTAAVVHDVGHPGLTNAFLVNTYDPIAVTHNAISPLESYHASRAFETMLNTCGCNFMEGLPRADVHDFWKKTVAIVMATDMSCHTKLVGELKARTAGESLKLGDAQDRMLLLKLLLKMADISNAARPWELCHKWACMVQEEFFAQGDLERSRGLAVSSFMDRAAPALPKMQVSFGTFVVLPLVAALADTVPELRFLRRNLEFNLRQWSALASGAALANSDGIEQPTLESLAIDTSVTLSSMSLSHHLQQGQ
eukprot:m51a1_g7744 putative protein (1782) ;mRNA; f:8438-16404